MSSKEVYKGTGASRITLGSRQSTITPFFIRQSNKLRPSPWRKTESWQPLSEGFEGVIISKLPFTSRSISCKTNSK